MWRLHDTSEGLTDAGLSEAMSVIQAHADFFDPERPVVLARAPGRLDVMGGIADYSGSLVLELPLGAATWVAAQRSVDRRVRLLSTAPKARRSRGSSVCRWTRSRRLPDRWITATRALC